jgi:hypothetical protein
MPRKKAGGTSSTTRRTIRKSSEQMEEAVRLRAYHLYLAREGAPGTAEDDWLQAEHEIRGQATEGSRRVPRRSPPRPKR